MNIAITGLGIVSAIGCGTQATMAALRGMRSGIGPMRHLHSVHRELPVGEVHLSDDRLKAMLAIEPESEVSRTALMGMEAIAQALADAGVGVPGAVPGHGRGCGRVVLVSGTTVGGMDVTERQFDGTSVPADTRFVATHDCGSSTRLMASHFGSLFADAATVSTACSSAANAIMLGARLLEAGEADIVVAGGSEALSRFHLNGFNSLMILDGQQCRPFCATRAGLNLGEGAGYIVMERASHAASRQHEPLAWLTGWGNACDAFHQTASSADGEGAFLAMSAALREAGLAPSDIDYINAHGTGTPNNDMSESAALVRVFGSGMPPVSSTKGFTGHTTSASGGIEAVISILAMRHGFVPANIGWREPMPGGITPSQGNGTAVLRHVLCNSFGFGGNDTSLVFSASGNETEGNETEGPRHCRVREMARVEISSPGQLGGISQWVKPMEARRMGTLMKASLLASLQALHDAGVQCPDAIVTATAYGCVESSERLLAQIAAGGEAMTSPTHFMQSTHNTIGSNIAIKTRCHGYNMTYTQGAQSLHWALRDARMLIESGRCRTVLVGCHDECTPLLGQLMRGAGLDVPPPLRSTAIVLSC